MSVHAARLIWILPALALAGCGLPRDCEGTLTRIRDGELRVGVTVNEPWTRLDQGSDDAPGGIEPRLLKELAGQLNSRIRWRQDTESDLFEALQRGELDVVIGGLTDSTPFSHRAGLTQPYVTVGKQKHVWAVRPGENALLLRIDQFLQGRRSQIEQMLATESQQ